MVIMYMPSECPGSPKYCETCDEMAHEAEDQAKHKRRSIRTGLPIGNSIQQ